MNYGCKIYRKISSTIRIFPISVIFINETIPGDVIGAYADWLTSCVSMYGYVLILAQVKNAVCWCYEPTKNFLINFLLLNAWKLLKIMLKTRTFMLKTWTFLRAEIMMTSLAHSWQHKWMSWSVHLYYWTYSLRRSSCLVLHGYCFSLSPTVLPGYSAFLVTLAPSEIPLTLEFNPPLKFWRVNFTLMQRLPFKPWSSSTCSWLRNCLLKGIFAS